MSTSQSGSEIVLKVRMSRKATEALRAEILHVAKRLGLSPASVRIRRVGKGSRRSS